MNDKDVPHALTVTPDTVLHFTLTRNEDDINTHHIYPSSSTTPPTASATSATATTSSSSTSSTPTKCTMTLTHTSGTASHLAFKVKTTQPRRYLVRPNQGIIAPGRSETVTILLVEKDKSALLQSFDRLGQNGLDHSKDKFLVQSCAVDTAFAKEYLDQKKRLENTSAATSNSNSGGGSGGEEKTKGGLTEILTNMWNQASGGGVDIHNKKLQVRHTVHTTTGTTNTTTTTTTSEKMGGGRSTSTKTVAASNVTPPSSTEPTVSPKDMTPQQLLGEITALRRKYDELVSFSVNLTAERDILNNTLEQTKRDLTREMAARSVLENDMGQVRTESSRSSGAGGAGVSLLVGLVLAVVWFVVGLKAMQVEGFAEFMMELPVVGEIMKLDLGLSLKETVETVVEASTGTGGGEL